MISGTRYTEGRPNEIDVEINDPSSTSTLITLSADKTAMAEGDSATFTFTRAGGDTGQPLTVDIRVDDPEDLLRGNHWDVAPEVPTQVVFPANATSQTMILTASQDQRDLEDGDVTVTVLVSDDYLLGNTGLGTNATVSVTDDAAAQRLKLKWGYLAPDDSSWEAGEGYLDCSVTPCAPGPAEGTFYYEDGRTFQFSDELEEYWPAHFMVTRHGQDKGKTATFVVRVEHNRGWESPRHADWPTDPVTGRRYQEFHLTLTGDQRTVVGRIEHLDNGLIDPKGYEYSAQIRPIEDVDGAELTADQEAQYWTVNGSRDVTIIPTERNRVQVDFSGVTPDPVPEGQQVTFTIKRKRGNLLEPLTVKVRTWEPSGRKTDGTNPTEMLHDVTFPAVPMTDRWVQYVTQTQTLTVDVQDDTVHETRDTLRADLFLPDGGLHQDYDNNRPKHLVHNRTVEIEDDDRPTIALSVDPSSITEGETATFTLTRGNNTTEDLIVGVSVDDPGGFLEGNFASDAVGVPTSVVFAPGDATSTVSLTPPDDWRDIPDSTLKFTVVDEPHYEIMGSASTTVQVLDNDVAPQVEISFNHAEVYEGTDLVLSIIRTGGDRNPLDIPMTAGPEGSQEYIVAGMDAGQSLLHIVYSRPDDSIRGPDVVYRVTLHPEAPEFWTPTGTTTTTGAILDNDPYLVGVEALSDSVAEGQLLYYRVYHNGHTGESLQVSVGHTETGSAVYDSTLGGFTHTIASGSSAVTRAFPTHSGDGSDGDAEFRVDLVAGDGYEIDASNALATVIVRDRDPLPVVEFPTHAEYVDEGDGNAEIPVDLTSLQPVLRTVTVDYEVIEGGPGTGPT